MLDIDVVVLFVCFLDVFLLAFCVFASIWTGLSFCSSFKICSWSFQLYSLSVQNMYNKIVWIAFLHHFGLHPFEIKSKNKTDKIVREKERWPAKHVHITNPHHRSGTISSIRIKIREPTKIEKYIIIYVSKTQNHWVTNTCFRRKKVRKNLIFLHKLNKTVVSACLLLFRREISHIAFWTKYRHQIAPPLSPNYESQCREVMGFRVYSFESERMFVFEW